VTAVYRSFVAAEAANDPELAALLAKNAALMQEAEQQQLQQQHSGQIKALFPSSNAESAAAAAAAHSTDLVVHIEGCVAAGVVPAAAASATVQVRLPHSCTPGVIASTLLTSQHCWQQCVLVVQCW
jgi:hypothetical protein